MPRRFTNLLPPERQRALKRHYYMRLAVVATWMVTVLIAIASVLLVPTYAYLSADAQTKENQLATAKATLATSNAGALSAQLSALSKDVATLSALQSAPSVSAIIRDILAVPRPGVTLSDFIYTAAKGKTPGSVTVSGTADTRDALHSYQLALQATSFASTANLPVSAYAQSSNIPFTVTITLSP